MKLHDIARELLKEIGENPERRGLIDTPMRMEKMWKEIFRGYTEIPPTLTTFPNKEDGIEYDQMIGDSGYFFSHCEHHMCPFWGQYYFAYIPNKHIIGLSKIARVVDYFSARLQTQERLVTQIVDYIDEEVKSLGIGLILKGRHLCKEMRGVKKIGGEMTTSDVRGVFRDNPSAKTEFLQLINLNINHGK